MSELAKAYVQIIPTMEGVQGKLESMLGGEADSAGKSAGGRAGSGFSAAFGKLAAAGLAAASAAVVKLGKDAVSGFAEYEQLAGGAQLLFGDAYDFVAEKAKNAYATVQMSQNEYLEQVNGFATGLKTSLGGNEAAAAELADRILTAEADIVAATGTSREAVQNAFNGIMKSNYSMLDNLQLGISPTKEGMQEVIDKVNEWNAANGKASDYVIDNLADVQSALVDYIEMQGLAGYASNEAAGTISGSISMLKSSWSNLVAGLANPDADIGALIGSMVESAKTAAGNLLPAISSALSGVGQLVSGLAPVIAQALPMLVSDVVPAIFQAAFSLVMTASEAVLGNLGIILQTGIQLCMELIRGLTESLPELIPVAIDAVLLVVDTLTDPDMLVELVDAALTLTLALANGLIEALPRLLAKAPEIVGNLLVAIVAAAPQLLTAAAELILTLANGLVKGFIEMSQQGRRLVEKVGEGFNATIGDAKTWGKDLIQKFIDGITAKFVALKQTVSSVAQTVKNFIGFSEPKEGPLSDFHTYAPDMMELFIDGIESKGNDLKKALTTIANVVKDIFSDIRQSMDLRQDIAGLEYQLWEKEYDTKNTALRNAEKKLKDAEGALEKTREANRDNDVIGEIMVKAAEATVAARRKEYETIKNQTDLDKYLKKQEMLNVKIGEQANIVAAAGSALEEIIAQYGEGSVESLKYQKTLLEEQNAYADLASEINEVIRAKQELEGSYNSNITERIADIASQRISATGAKIASTTNSVVVNVSGAEGQSVDELARKVERVITQSIARKEAAWA